MCNISLLSRGGERGGGGSPPVLLLLLGSRALPSHVFLRRRGRVTLASDSRNTQPDWPTVARSIPRPSSGLSTPISCWSCTTTTKEGAVREQRRKRTGGKKKQPKSTWTPELQSFFCRLFLIIYFFREENSRFFYLSKNKASTSVCRISSRLKLFTSSASAAGELFVFFSPTVSSFGGSLSKSRLSFPLDLLQKHVLL